MKYTKDQLTEFWNKAIENETGMPGVINPHLWSYDSCSIKTFSSNDDIIITLERVNIQFDLEDATVELRYDSSKQNWHYIL
jgi:hypothetical protein